MGFGQAPDREALPRMGTCLLDDADRVVVHDEAFASIVGHGHLIGRHVDDLFTQPPGDGAQPASLTVDGRKCLCARLKLATSQDGAVTSLMISDVTGQSLVEDRLRESLQAFWSLVESAPVGILVLDRHQKVTLWSSAAETLFGWSADEVMGQPYPLVPDSEREGFEQLFGRVISGEGFTGVEAWRARKDGSPVLLGISTAPVRNAVGEVVGAMALLSDLTKQRALEEQLQRAARMEAVGRLAGGVAHDFNNLLTVILANAQLMRARGLVDPQLVQFVDEIEHCADRAGDLTAQLLTFGRRNVVQQKATCVNSTIEQAAAILRRVAGERIEVDIDLGHDLPRVNIDPGQLEQFLMNMVVNAADAMPSGGRVTIETNRCRDAPPGIVVSETGFVCVRVRDGGVGIEPEVLPHIFEPFFTTKQSGGGTGIGLATVYGIVTRAGGYIDVRSEPGEFTEFHAWLPALGDEVAVAEARAPAVTPTGRGRVMLVEDNDLVRRATTALVETMGYEVHSVASGADALAACATGEIEPDVVLTDVYMPKMNGRQLADALARLLPELTVVFMSGNLSDQALRDRVERGEALYVGKPIDGEQLYEVLERAIHSRHRRNGVGDRSNAVAGDGTKLSYWQTGDGPHDVVIVHGWMATGETFSPLVAELERTGALDGRRVTQVDLRGVGDSDKPDTGYDHEQLVADLVSVLDAASIESATVVGHSMGGQLAQVLAVAHPDRVSSLVLINPVPTTGLPLPDPVATVFEAAAEDVGAQGNVVDMSTKQLSDEGRAMLMDSAASASPVCTATTLTMWTAGKPDVDVSRISVPTAVIGTDDGFLPQPFLQEAIADRIDDAKLMHMPGIGHYPHLEATAALAEMLKAILSS
jgi:PAS domain S-box-containing protein